MGIYSILPIGQSVSSVTPFFENSLSIQKKIALVAVAVLSALALLFLLYQRCYFTATKTETLPPGGEPSEEIKAEPSETKEAPQPEKPSDQVETPYIEAQGMASKPLVNPLADQLKSFFTEHRECFGNHRQNMTIYIDESGTLNGIHIDIFGGQDKHWLKPETENDVSALFAFKLQIGTADPSKWHYFSTKTAVGFGPYSQFELSYAPIQANVDLPEALTQLVTEAVEQLNQMAEQAVEKAKASRESNIRPNCTWKQVFLQNIDPMVKKTIRERLENNRRDALRQQARRILTINSLV